MASAASAESAEDYINADRPGIADGSTVVGNDRFQVEAALQWESHSRGGEQDRRVFAPTLLRLGLDRSWELRVEGNTYSRTRSRSPGQHATTSEGLAPTSFGLKHQFNDGAGARQPSFGAILRIFPASGSDEFRTSHTTGDFRLAADWEFAPKWSLNPNIGVAIYEDDAGHAYSAGLLAATLNYNPSEVLNLFVDSAIQGPEARNGRVSVIVDAGVDYILGRNLQLDLSVGTSAAGLTTPRPFIAAGISRRFF